MLQITDMPTWISDNSDRIYGFLVYKKIYTPYEQEQKFEDESQFENEQLTFCKIKEAVDLGSGDWLLGLQLLFKDDPNEDANNLDYHRLSDIQLCSYDWMQHRFDDEIEDEDERIKVVFDNKNMRDIKRIDDFCEELKKIWKRVPDLRFGQFMINALEEMSARGRDPFFPEDCEMIEFLNDYTAQYSLQ